MIDWAWTAETLMVGLTVYFNPFDGATIEENNACIARGWIPMLWRVER